MTEALTSGPEMARPRRQGPLSGLLVDWGGVMTSSLFSSFSAFCESEGLRSQHISDAFRNDPHAHGLLIGFEEGRITEDDFERELGGMLGLTEAEGLIERLFTGVANDEAMIAAVRNVHRAGLATGLISNSWGTTRYPRGLLDEIFDGVVLSGEVGIRKPAPRIYELGAEAIGRDPSECVFVDDLIFNLPPARALGMEVIHHTGATTTIPELERLLGVSLRTSERLPQNRRADKAQARLPRP